MPLLAPRPIESFYSLSCALQPLNSFVLQRIIHTEGFAGGPAAATSDAVIRLNIDRAMLI
jgi:hypothetical protein